MGLDLYCGEESQRMGSYSSVHAERAAWIQAEAKRQASIGNSFGAQRIRKLIIKTTGNVVIDYKAFQQMDWLPGIRAFVYHSDCDGHWTPEEAKEMLEAVSALKPFFPKDHSSFDKNKEYYLESIWKKSVETHDCICFY